MWGGWQWSFRCLDDVMNESTTWTSSCQCQPVILLCATVSQAPLRNMQNPCSGIYLLAINPIHWNLCKVAGTLLLVNCFISSWKFSLRLAKFLCKSWVIFGLMQSFWPKHRVWPVAYSNDSGRVKKGKHLNLFAKASILAKNKHKGSQFGNLVWRAMICWNFASVEAKSFGPFQSRIPLTQKVCQYLWWVTRYNTSVYSSPGVYRARLMRQSYHLPQINRPPSFKMSSISRLSRSNMWEMNS